MLWYFLPLWGANAGDLSNCLLLSIGVLLFKAVSMIKYTKIDVAEYVKDGYSEKEKNGECRVYWDHFGVDAIAQSEVDPDAYHIAYGGLHGCGVEGYVGLTVMWKE
jgi:hypothetical protein